MNKEQKLRNYIRKLIKEEKTSLKEQGEEGTPPEANTSPGENQQSLERTKVKLFFDALQKSDRLMSLLQFQNPIEQAQAIIKFAEIVGVPAGSITGLIQQIRQLHRDKNKK